MLHGIVDNVQIVYLIFGAAALGLAAWWWRTREGKYLLAAGGAAAVVALAFVLSLLVVTDRKQLVANVDDVIGKMNQGDFDGAFRHFSDPVELTLGKDTRRLPRAAVQAMAKLAMQQHRLKLVTLNVGVDKLEPPTALVTFNIRPDDELRWALCEVEWVRVGDLDWRVKSLKVTTPADAKPPFRFPSWP